MLIFKHQAVKVKDLYNENRNMWIADLLEGGKTTGETVRLLFSPSMRKVTKPEGEGESPPGGGDEEKEEGGEDKSPENTQRSKEPEQPPVESAWFNMVCYGLPNLMVAQI